MNTPAAQGRPRQISNNSQPGSRPGAGGGGSGTSSPVGDRRQAQAGGNKAVPKAKAAQLKLEHFYKLAVEAAVERNTR
ncbi:7714_t:CDS:2 [Acaulospora colombiana]|uniref:7714_t:CDS:1 n=1 Tax=Acaulospora colombiana TaxID=27376 RepID=A0ACA9PEC2_9GLOM|nr:7714_t:CDS:2 [Acaulospora colombiana]